MQRLEVPGPGELTLARRFIDRRLIDEVNEIFGHSPGNRFYHRRVSKEDWQVISSARDKLPTDTLVDTVVRALPFEWQKLNVYVRYMGSTGVRALGVHNDNDPSLRVLVEGNSSRWIFDTPPYSISYPEGLPLHSGDAVTLNNYCPPDKELRHGVEIDGIPSRISYLLCFYA